MRIASASKLFDGVPVASASTGKADGRVDVVAQYGLTNSHVAGEKLFNCLGEKSITVRVIALCTSSNGVSKFAKSVPSLTSPSLLVVGPPRLCPGNILLLPLLRPTARQENNLGTIPAEVDAVAWPEIYLELQHTPPDRFDIRSVSRDLSALVPRSLSQPPPGPSRRTMRGKGYGR